MAYKVKSWLRVADSNIEQRDVYNGELGPFSDRTAAERALVALCQSGRATRGEIVEDDDTNDPALMQVEWIVGLLRDHIQNCDSKDTSVADALAEMESLRDAIANS